MSYGYMYACYARWSNTHLKKKTVVTQIHVKDQKFIRCYQPTHQQYSNLKMKCSVAALAAIGATLAAAQTATEVVSSTSTTPTPPQTYTGVPECAVRLLFSYSIENIRY